MRVDIIFKTSSTPKVIKDARAAYVRPGVLCIELEDGLITVYPFENIFMYSYPHQPHQGTTKKKVNR